MCRGISFCVLVRPGCKSHFSYSASVGDLSLKHKSCAHSTVAFGLALLPCPAPLGAPCPGWWVDQLPPAQAQAGMGSSGPIGPPLLQLLAPLDSRDVVSCSWASGSPVRMASSFATTCCALSKLKHIGGLNFRMFLPGPSVLSRM